LIRENTHFPQKKRSLSFRVLVSFLFQNTRTDVGLLGPCYKTGPLRPFVAKASSSPALSHSTKWSAVKQYEMGREDCSLDHPHDVHPRHTLFPKLSSLVKEKKAREECMSSEKTDIVLTEPPSARVKGCPQGAQDISSVFQTVTESAEVSSCLREEDKTTFELTSEPFPVGNNQLVSLWKTDAGSPLPTKCTSLVILTR